MQQRSLRSQAQRQTPTHRDGSGPLDPGADSDAIGIHRAPSSNIEALMEANSLSWGRGEVALQVQFRTSSVLEDVALSASKREKDAEGRAPETAGGSKEVAEEVPVPVLGSPKQSGEDHAVHTDVHMIPIEELLQRLDTPSDMRGLSAEVAAARLEVEGPNLLTPVKQPPLVLTFIVYLFEGFGVLLWASAVLCFIAWYPLSYRQPGGWYNFALFVCLIFVIIFSGLFNFLQVG